MTTTSQPTAYSPTSSNTIDTITISGIDTIDWGLYNTMDTSNSITYVSSPSSYTYTTGGTITLPSITTAQISSLTIDTSTFKINTPEEWVVTFPNWNRVEDMCKKYPALEIAFRNFKTVYQLVKDDYDNPTPKK